MPPKFKRHLNDDEVTGSVKSERVSAGGAGDLPVPPVAVTVPWRAVGYIGVPGVGAHGGPGGCYRASGTPRAPASPRAASRRAGAGELRPPLPKGFVPPQPSATGPGGRVAVGSDV